METRIDEIAPDIYRLSTWVDEIAPPAGFTFNQFLVRDEQPFLFHTGMRALFPLVSEAVSRIVPLADLRWIAFAHIEADECGAMNQFLAAAPGAEVAHGMTGVMVSLNDQADRPPVAWADGQVVDLGAHRVRHIDTPHVPHCWDAGALYDETTGTLFCGDLLTHAGRGSPLTDSDILGPALEAEQMFRAMSMAPSTAATLRALAELKPATLALMHGSSLRGDCAATLEGLASFCERECVLPSAP